MDEGGIMGRERMTSVGAALIALTTLAGCAGWPGQKDEKWIVIQEPSRPSPQQLCEVTALAQERKSAIQTVEGADIDGWQEGETFLARKLQSYEARMEIAYRSMVSSCNIYANCLDRNGGSEERCTRSESGYMSARQQFFTMVSEADELAAEIEVARYQAVIAKARADEAKQKAAADAAKRRADAAKKTPAKKDEGSKACKPDCATTGNIFTDNCCPMDKKDD